MSDLHFPGSAEVRRGKPRSLALTTPWPVAACVVAASVAVTLTATVPALSDLTFWTTFAIFSALCAFNIATAGRHPDGSVDVLAPAAPFSLAMFVHFGLGAVYGWTGVGPQLDHNPLPALVLATVGLGAFTVGYRLPVASRAKSIADRIPEWRPRRAALAAAILVAVGATFTVLGYGSAGAFFTATKEQKEASGTDSEVGYFAALLLVGLSLLAPLVASTMRRRRAQLMLVLLALVPLVFVLTGRRIFVFLALATVGFAWHYYIGRIRLPLLFALGAFTILLVNPLGQLWRTTYQSMGATAVTDIPAVAGSFASNLSSMSGAEYLDYALGERFERLNEAETVAAMRATIPSTADYKYGQTFLPIVTWLIPRFFWPDKPDFQFFNEVGHTTGLITPWDKFTTIVYTSVGELYLNFGDAGVAIGMLIIGLLSRWLYQALIVGARSALGIFAYGLLVLPLWTEEALGPSIGGELRNVCTAVVVLLLCRALVPRRGASLAKRRRPAEEVVSVSALEPGGACE